MISAQLLAQAGQIFAWYNAVFVVIFGVGLFFTLLQLIGLGHDGDADAHAETDVHAEAGDHVEVHAEMDAGAHAEIDGHAPVHTEAGAEGHTDAQPHGEGHGPSLHGAGTVGTVAQILGLGRVPLSISLMLLSYTAGIVGWASNEVLGARIGTPAKFFPLSLLLALASGLLMIRLAGSIMGRYLPAFSTTAIDRRQLVGMTATAILPVNDKYGQVSLHDQFGTLHVMGCRVRDGAQPIEKGASVVLIRYLPERDMFVVGRA